MVEGFRVKGLGVQGFRAEAYKSLPLHLKILRARSAQKGQAPTL